MNNRSERKAEVTAKLARLRQRMAARGVSALFLTQSANTAWITAGAATYVNEATDGGTSSILVTPEHAYVLTDVIEGPRLQQEERLADLGFEMIVEKWYARGSAVDSIAGPLYRAQDGPGSGQDFGPELQRLRVTLDAFEVERMRKISRITAEAMNEAIHAVKPGLTEFELAGLLAKASRDRGGSPIVTLVATDERISQYRHPLPTAKVLQNYAMLVICMRVEGLIACLTRLVHFGKLPQDLEIRMKAVAYVDAALILGTKPGHTLGELFGVAQGAYGSQGYPEAIEEHHQGGSMAYLPREVLARPGEQTPIEVNQAFGWNPSVRGVKSEDTTLLTAQGVEVTTEIPGWPMLEVEIADQKIARPLILEV